VVEILFYARVAKYNLNCRTRVWYERSRVMTPLGVGMNSWSRGPLFLKTELNLSAAGYVILPHYITSRLLRGQVTFSGLIKKIREPYFQGTCFKNERRSFSKTFASYVRCCTLWWVRKIGCFVKF